MSSVSSPLPLASSAGRHRPGTASGRCAARAACPSWSTAARGTAGGSARWRRPDVDAVAVAPAGRRREALELRGGGRVMRSRLERVAHRGPGVVSVISTFIPRSCAAVMRVVVGAPGVARGVGEVDRRRVVAIRVGGDVLPVQDDADRAHAERLQLVERAVAQAWVAQLGGVEVELLGARGLRRGGNDERDEQRAEGCQAEGHARQRTRCADALSETDSVRPRRLRAWNTAARHAHACPRRRRHHPRGGRAQRARAAARPRPARRLPRRARARRGRHRGRAGRRGPLERHVRHPPRRLGGRDPPPAARPAAAVSAHDVLREARVLRATAGQARVPRCSPSATTRR